MEPLDIVCPRCGAGARERFHGPCARCRDELRATQGRSGRYVDVGDYEPKVNVVPNQVASKD